MDAIELLRADHDKVLRMLDELEAGSPPPAEAAGNDEALRTRKDLVTEVVIAEAGHEAVEEQYFWPFVRDLVPGGPELAATATEQEYAAKQLLDALDKARPSQSDFEEMVRRLIEDGREHIAYEQDVVWPKVLSAVDSTTLARLGAQMAEAKEKAPTRPHPETPSSPLVQKTVGRVAAAIDRARDSLSGRGH